MSGKYIYSVTGTVFLTLVLAVSFTNCQSSTSSTLSDPQDPDNTANSSCSDDQLTSLELQMTQTLQNTPSTESFYLELRRNSDGRTFTFSRLVSGKTTVTGTTSLQSASTAKMITAAVILDVISNPSLYPGGGVVNGRSLSLDSLARQFLPKTGGGTVWSTNTGAIPTNNRLFNVSLRHLLSFTSGLEAESACISSTTVAHNDCITRLVTANVNLGENTANAPRTYFYNGSHLFVAAQMAVNAAGVGSWAELFKRFKENHGVFQSSIPTPDLAAMGVGAFYPNSTAGTYSPSPAGALRYRASDYAPFLLKLAKGQIINTALLEEMQKDQISFLNTNIKYSPMQDDGEDWHYGFGLWLECPASTFSINCFEDRYSSPGSFGSYPFMDYNFWNNTPNLFVGFLGYGDTTPGQAIKGINIYRSLKTSSSEAKDLAQKWAANQCGI